ncbi:MAG: hypothetical protein ACN2B6_05670 [Rickettsiales bacterium]
MSDPKKKIFYVEGDDAIRESVGGFLRQQWGNDYEVICEKDTSAFAARPEGEEISLVILGDSIKGTLEPTIEIIRENGNFPIILSNTHEGVLRQEHENVHYLQLGGNDLSVFVRAINGALSSRFTGRGGDEQGVPKR